MSKKEWLCGDESELLYHMEQYKNPKYYTLKLLEYFKEWNIFDDTKTVIDFACGGGANISLFASIYNDINFCGVDLNEKYINFAIENKKYNNIDFYVDDMSSKNMKINKYDGALCLQTLSWLTFTDYKKTLNNIIKMNPNWMLFTSLYYDGPVDTKIQIKDYTRNMGNKKYRTSYYNIYSLGEFETYLNKHNYYIDKNIPFEMDYDLERPIEKGMGTYTKKLLDNSRIQISGPLLMPWYTILAKKEKINYEFFKRNKNRK